jgi:hypothetical protein
MTDQSLSQVLAGIFGSDFSGATQEQRLLLLEAVALTLRIGGAWSNNLRFLCSRARTPKMPQESFPFVQISTNEGLKLLAILNVVIVEGYSSFVAAKRFLNDR